MQNAYIAYSAVWVLSHKHPDSIIDNAGDFSSAIAPDGWGTMDHRLCGHVHLYKWDDTYLIMLTIEVGQRD